MDEDNYKLIIIIINWILQNIINRKKKPYGYDAAQMEDMEAEDGENNVLSKYDEEIEGEKKTKFKLGNCNYYLA